MIIVSYNIFNKFGMTSRRLEKVNYQLNAEFNTQIFRMYS